MIAMTFGIKKSLKKAMLLVITLAVPLAIFWSTGIYEAFGMGRGGKVPQDRTDRLFKELGIIRLSGMAPPVEIELKNINGKIINVSDFRGKIVFLNFWTTWCPECRVEMPGMEKLFQRFKEDDFAMIAINLRETSKTVNTFFNKNKLTFSALLDSDGSVGTAFGIRSIPTTIILDKRGGLLGKALGSRQWGGRKAVVLFETLVRSSFSPGEIHE